MTEGDWRVRLQLDADNPGSTVFQVVSENPPAGAVIAECSDAFVSRADARDNARAIAAVPQMVRALLAAETLIGDLPRSARAADCYRLVSGALGLAGVDHAE